MDILEEQVELGPSLGHEAHQLDAIAQTFGKYRRGTLSLEEMEETLEDVTTSKPNNFPLEAKTSLWRA
jgi:hypothetical protein